MRIIKSVLLNKYQNILLKFQQKDVIESTSGASEFEGLNMNIVDLIKHPNISVSTFYTSKINNLIDEYKSKDLKSIDKKILKGIVRMNYFNDSLSSEENNINEVSIYMIDKPITLFFTILSFATH